jgi:iron(III) transport system permease protein
MSGVSLDPAPAALRLPPRRRIRVTAATLFQHAIFLLVLLLVATPLAFLILGSFSTAQIPGDVSFADLSLANYRTAWLDPALLRLVDNTLIYVIGSTLLGTALAALLAWLAERTDLPGKGWIYAGVPMTLAVPGMLQAMAWILLLSPRVGFANTALKDLLGLDRMPFDIYTLPGMIFVEGLRLVPTAFLMLVPLLRAMDPSLEEAAATCGANPRTAFRRVSLMLLKPGLAAVLIYQAMTALEVFEVPGVLGLPAGIPVFSTRIYSILNSASFGPAYGQANALGILYLAVAVLATFAYIRIIGRSERYATVTGKGFRPRRQRLGGWRLPMLLLVLSYLFLSVGAPFLALLYISFLKVLQVPSAAAFASMSLANYRDLLASDSMGTVLWNTILMVAVTALATTLLSFLISLVVVRSRFWGRKILDQLAFFPHAIPGMVMGLAMLWLFLKLDRYGLPLFGTIWTISIAFTISFISYGTRAMNAAVLQIHKDLEEAARTSGAREWRIAWRVFLPLMLPSFIGLFVWALLHAVRIAGTPLLLYEGQQNQVLAVTIWNMWDEGYVTSVGAIGTLLMLVLLAATLALRMIGFGRDRA